MEGSGFFARKGGSWVRGMSKEKPEERRASDLLEEKRVAIGTHIQRPKNKGENFVTVASLRKVWKLGGLQEFIEGVGIGFKANREQLEFIEKNLLRTISILVCTQWKQNRWQKFPEIFMKDGSFRDDRLDSRLPYELGALKNKDFLGSWGRYFYANQDIFIPIVLKQSEIIKHCKKRRLPLKTGGRELGSGASGRFTQEVIPEGCLVWKGEGEATNTKDLEVARKVILVKKDSDTKIRNLKKLLEGLGEHRRIATNIAAVVIRNEFNLFFELPKTDLSALLYGLEDPVDLKALIVEASNLVDALHFLHSGLSSQRGYGGTAREVCYYTDLKPENILVYERSSDPNDVVGRWKIADFCISWIDALSYQTIVPLSANMTTEVGRQVRGVYSAPEIPAGRLGDIWSFGCIFHQILAAGLGGGPLIRKLDGERAKTIDYASILLQSNRFYTFEEGRKKAVLKPCVELWLENELPKHPRRLKSDVTQECSKLVMEMLQTDESKRPNALTVKTRLDSIIAGRAMPALAPITSEPIGGTTAQEPPRTLTVSEPVKVPTDRGSEGPPGMPASSPPLPLSLDLIDAVRSVNLALVCDLMRGDARILARDSSGFCAIHYAAQLPGEEVLLQLLMSKELEGDNISGINQRTNSGDTPLHLATSGKIVPVLINAGADRNAKNNYGQTPLHAATIIARNEIVSELIKAGADKNAKDDYGRTPLHCATMVARNEIVSELIKAGADKNAKDDYGRTPLHCAVLGARKEIASELISAGANKNVKDDDGRTPLHYAAVRARKEIGSELIKAGADKDVKDTYGRTPLHAASLVPNIENVNFVEFLLDSGAIETPNLPPEFKIKRNYIMFRKHRREKMNSG